MQKRNNRGFTLVELVVVIAIIGILSGIGVAAYSGYIDHARRAADEELIYAVNTAFQSACEENGVAFNGLKNKGAALLIERGDNCLIKGVKRVTGVVDLDSFSKDFDGYFAGNEKTPLKYYNWLSFVEGKGFKGSVMLIGEKNGKVVAVTQDNADAFNDSAFNDVGADNLLNEVNKVVQAFAALTGGGGTGNQLYNMLTQEPEFLNFASQKLGGILSADEIKKALNGDTNGLTEEQLAALATLGGETAPANIMVLYAASKSGGLMNDETFMAQLKNLGDSINGVEAGGEELSIDAMLPLLQLMQAASEGGDDMGRGVAKAAYGYGLLFSFNEYQKDNPDATWTQYLDSKEASQDMAAYVACMDMINSNTTDLESTSALLSGGFNDPDFVAALMEALNKK